MCLSCHWCLNFLEFAFQIFYLFYQFIHEIKENAILVTEIIEVPCDSDSGAGVKDWIKHK